MRDDKTRESAGERERRTRGKDAGKPPWVAEVPWAALVAGIGIVGCFAASPGVIDVTFDG